ncbi:MAG: hypothetical protein AB1472_00435 [Candidatus Omnitrophota bacterium]
MTTLKLKIADIIIELKSKFPMQPINEKISWRFCNFIYKGKKRAQIVLTIEVVNQLPKVKFSKKRIFLTRHPATNEKNWALYKSNGLFILATFVVSKIHEIFLNQDFTRGKVYYKTTADADGSWKPEDIIYDALQVILINYITGRDGIFVHAVGMKDIDKRGLLFVGKSGDGKSTTARIWHKFSEATVLNDDRIIIRKNKDKFLIYGCPWHGEFTDYLISKIETTDLNSVFFLEHSKFNSFQLVPTVKAFNLLYPCTFHTFWDRKGIGNAIRFSSQLTKEVPCFKLGFKNDKEMIEFVRGISLKR